MEDFINLRIFWSFKGLKESPVGFSLGLKPEFDYFRIVCSKFCAKAGVESVSTLHSRGSI